MEKMRAVRDVTKEAEQVILKLKERGNGQIAIKTSQLRKFLTAVNALSNKIEVFEAKHAGAKELTPELASEVRYLKVKFVYQAGRMREVREFGDVAKLRDWIEGIGESLASYHRFAQYMEALVAFHKFYGGKE